MNKRIKKRWISALRGNRYKQGMGRLKYGRGETSLYCCLGVLEDIAVGEGVIPRVHAKFGSLSKKVREWAGLELSDPYLSPQRRNTMRASRLNDSGKDFKSIADRIEKYL